ncbi:potassium channel family protein [Brevibacillus dissolubilis]|uniref:potassium channel family protein n=1 Tax=Brevibacillus dissolubilis TaxID=1844116 RepID=UPI00111761EE|nr:ion transporter [Brevibacillus dissolubilis]
MWRRDSLLKRMIFSKPIEYIMGTLAVLIVLLYLSEFYYHDPQWGKTVALIETTIVSIFAFEYFIKLWFTDDKWGYIRTHWIELLSIIPLSVFFQSLRLIRVLRIVILLQYAFHHWEPVLRRNTFFYVTFLTFSVVILASFAVYHFESAVPDPSMENIGDALWWSWVTTTTVGYGDITPKTPEGRLIAAVLMLVGISFLGVMTGTIASYFIRMFHNYESVHDAQLKTIHHQLNQLDKLTREDMEDLQQTLIFLWEREQLKKQNRRDFD